MTKWFIAAAAVALLTAPAFAQSSNEALGYVRYIDEEGGRFLLDSNDFFTAGDGVDLSTLGVGDRVTVTFDGTVGEGELTATAVEPAAQPEG